MYAEKDVGITFGSSTMESEAIASAKAGESVSYAREILRAFGVPPDGPTLIVTDNLANFRRSTSRPASAARAGRSTSVGARRHSPLIPRRRYGYAQQKAVKRGRVGRGQKTLLEGSDGSALTPPDVHL